MTESVRLIAISQPVVEDCKVPGDLIAFCARVSSPANQANQETAPKLLRYLAKHAHWSPFEMASMTLELHTTRSIAHQIIRHRSFSFQEFSQRYAAVAPKFVIGEARLQDVKNRQASHETEDTALQIWWEQEQCALARHAGMIYEQALARGLAKEVARNVLPEGMTPSTLYMAGNIRSWIHYCQLRTTAGTQKEHRAIALTCLAILCREIPALVELLNAAS